MNKSFLRTVLNCLEKHPRKALGKGAFYDKTTDLCCVMGTVPQIKHYATGSYPATGNEEFVKICESLGGDWKDARDLGLINDNFNGTPEERYQYMLKWLNANLSTVSIS